MPDPSSTNDDRLGDLFSTSSERAEHDSGAPLSRREAREAAARSTAGAAHPDGSRPDGAHADAARHAAVLPPAAATTPAPAAAALPAAPALPPSSALPPAPALPPTAALPPTSVLPVTPETTLTARDQPAATGVPGPLRGGAAPASASPMVVTLDDLFTSDDGTGKPPRRKRRIGGWIALGVVLVLVGGAVGTGVWVWNTYEDKIREVMGWEEPKDYEDGQAHGEALVTIASGDIPSTISKSLFEAGVTKTPEAFYDMLIKTSQNPVFYPGVYQLQKQMSAAAALDAIKDPANKMEHSALLREGLTVAQSLPILADSLGIPLKDFQAAVKKPADFGVKADSLEGWLFPATYTFDPGVTAHEVVAALVSRTMKSLSDAGVPEADRQHIITIASIIQREARLKDDFYKVSRVIQNRLDQGWQLQMDSTAQFGYGEMHDGTVSSSAAALADPNPWNTYKIPGLPIGPISNPGDTAIDAAMHPAKGPWMFFVTWNLNTGETIFSTTDAEHEQAKQKWIAWCKDNPNAGC